MVGGWHKTLNLQWTTNKTHKERDDNFMMIHGPITTSYTTLQSHPITGTPISFLWSNGIMLLSKIRGNGIRVIKIYWMGMISLQINTYRIKNVDMFGTQEWYFNLYLNSVLLFINCVFLYFILIYFFLFPVLHNFVWINLTYFY